MYLFFVLSFRDAGERRKNTDIGDDEPRPKRRRSCSVLATTAEEETADLEPPYSSDAGHRARVGGPSSDVVRREGQTEGRVSPRSSNKNFESRQLDQVTLNFALAVESSESVLQHNPSDSTSENSAKLTVSCWNVGGMYQNHGSIFEQCKEVDISCFIKTFLENDTAPHLRIPKDSHALFVPGKRGPHSRRASGGFALLIKNSVAKPADCDFVEKFPGICVASLKLVTGVQIKIIVVYRAAKEGTPLFNPNFYVNLMEALSQYGDENLIVLGDFNTKMGDMQGPLGILDFAGDILPNSAESSDVDPHAEDLFEVLTSAQLYGIFDDSNGTVLDTFICRDGSCGGSLIDFVYVNDLLFPFVDSSRARFPNESNHALITVRFELDVPVANESDDPPRRSTVRLFDVAKLNELEHTEGINRLSDSTDGFDVRSALNVILEYVDQYTQVVRTAGPRREKKYESAATVAAKRDARLVERRMRLERDTELRRAYRAQWLVACAHWRAFRDQDTQLAIEESRRNFFEAVADKNLYRAWKIARRNLSGKGGGIRDSVTSFIDHSDWEEHFSGLFAGASSVLNAPVTGARSHILDSPFTGDEVSMILDRKRNHRALGPDGFSLDHVRILRYDEKTCRALANFMNLCVAEASIPDEWGRAFLFILYKGTGPKDNANNFRGITLKSQLLKLLESLMCDRLRIWAELKQLLPREQLAYRPGHNGVDHLYSLSLLKEHAKSHGQRLHAAFIDLRKAFPSVNRQRLLDKLALLGVSDNFLRMLTRLYTGDSFSILLDGVSSVRTFQVNTGVHEGSPLSPLLFILFIAQLAEFLQTHAIAHGYRIDASNVILCLLYADDVLLISPTREGLQELIRLTCQFFNDLGLVVNPDKSDIVIFSPGYRFGTTDFDVAGLTKEDIREAKYLGLIFSHNGSWKAQLEATLTRCRMARGRSHIICSSLGLNRARPMIQIFDMFVSAIYRYSLGVWGLSGDLRRVDNLFCDFVKRQYRLPQSTCRKGILMQFARRCANCDAHYLAAVHLARGLTSPNSVWGRVVSASWQLDSITWVRNLKSRLALMGIEDELIRDPASFLGRRREWGLRFSEWCHTNHLVFVNGTSADYFRYERRFGMYPLIFDLNVGRVRSVLTLLLSCWRWASDLRNVPEYCIECDCLINAPHLLFRCIHTERFRSQFQRQTGVVFQLSNFSNSELNEEIARTCDEILRSIRSRFVQ